MELEFKTYFFSSWSSTSGKISAASLDGGFHRPVTSSVPLYGLAKLSFLKRCWISKEAVLFLIDLMPVPLSWEIPCAAQWNMDDKNWTSGPDLSQSLVPLSGQVMLNRFYFQSAVFSVFPFKFSRVIIAPGGPHICSLWSVKSLFPGWTLSSEVTHIEYCLWIVGEMFHNLITPKWLHPTFSEVPFCFRSKKREKELGWQ